MLEIKTLNRTNLDEWLSGSKDHWDNKVYFQEEKSMCLFFHENTIEYHHQRRFLLRNQSHDEATDKKFMSSTKLWGNWKTILLNSINKRKLTFIGHAIQSSWLENDILTGMFIETCRRGRPSRRLEYDVHENLGPIMAAQNQDCWKQPVEGTTAGLPWPFCLWWWSNSIKKVPWVSSVHQAKSSCKAIRVWSRKGNGY